MAAVPDRPDPGPDAVSPCPVAADARQPAPWAAGRAGRAARAAVLALVAVALAGAAHGYACGRVPSWPVLVTGLLLTWRIGWGLSARRISFPRVAGVVLAVQAVLHVAFVVGAARPHRMLPSSAGAVHVGEPVHLLPASQTMTLMHLAAAVCLAWWMAVGERLLWRAARGVVAVARRAAARRRGRGLAVVPTVAPPSRWSGPARSAAELLVLRHSLIRRGPPVLSGA